jgi:high-affinity K+ transport system ATPase subunit B
LSVVKSGGTPLAAAKDGKLLGIIQRLKHREL